MPNPAVVKPSSLAEALTVRAAQEIFARMVVAADPQERHAQIVVNVAGRLFAGAELVAAAAAAVFCGIRKLRTPTDRASEPEMWSPDNLCSASTV